MRKAFIKTLGCQMNERDSSNMEGLLLESGYQVTEDPSSADLILLNTCVIRQKARQKARSQIGSFGILKKEKDNLKIGICGCMVTCEANDIFDRFPFVDFVLGPDRIGELPNVLKALDLGPGKIISDKLHDGPEGSFVREDYVLNERVVSCFVTAMKGCSNCCSYCVVPMVRGPAVSRPSEEIIDVINGLVGKGVTEVTLLGQSVNSYLSFSLVNKSELVTFSKLLKQIAAIKGLKRLRFTTSHPRDFSDELIEVFGELDILASHVHLPIQSGSDAILEGMNRGYTRSWYVDRVNKLRKIRPDIHISTDIIVGFPGESEQDFQDTYNLVNELSFDHMFIFKYSPRPNTKANEFNEGLVPEDVKQRRFEAVLKLFESMVLDKHLALVGTTQDILVEGQSKIGNDLLTGRTSGNKVVNFSFNGNSSCYKGEWKDLIGQIVPVRITFGYMHSLKGQLDNK